MDHPGAGCSIHIEGSAASKSSAAPQLRTSGGAEGAAQAESLNCACCWSWWAETWRCITTHSYLPPQPTPEFRVRVGKRSPAANRACFGTGRTGVRQSVRCIARGPEDQPTAAWNIGFTSGRAYVCQSEET